MLHLHLEKTVCAKVCTLCIKIGGENSQNMKFKHPTSVMALPTGPHPTAFLSTSEKEIKNNVYIYYMLNILTDILSQFYCGVNYIFEKIYTICKSNMSYSFNI